MHTYQPTAVPFSRLTDQIERFRDASRQRGSSPPVSRKGEHFCDAFSLEFNKRPYWERYARSMGRALEQEPAYMFDDEQLVGMLYQLEASRLNFGLCEEEPLRKYSISDLIASRELKAGINLHFYSSPWPGHIGWSWDAVVTKGVDGLMRDIRERLSQSPDIRARRLYRGALISWRSVLRWNEKHIRSLRERAAQADGEERKRLNRLIRICTRVPRKPARNFREALQSFYFQYLAVMFENPWGGNGPGRVDYFLWPYLEQDLAAGKITMAEAKDLIDELLIRLHERIQLGDGWVEAIMVGGVHPDGTSSLNPLSYMLIDSIGALDQTHPSVYVRLRNDDPEDFFDLNVRYLLNGKNRAQIYNDEKCREAIVRTGVPEEDAAMFMAGGCMEISVQGMACDMNFTGTINVAKTLELVLNGGVDMLTGERLVELDRTLADFDNFDELCSAFEDELAKEYTEWSRSLDIGSECFAELRPCYLLSSLMADCIERGREQQDGGARYHDYGFSPLGVTSVADSLNAIRVAIYDDGFVSGAELLAAMRANYEGHEVLRARLHNIPRYGVQDVGADAVTDRVVAGVCNLATGTKNRFGGSLKPMVFSFVWIPDASAILGARADGQYAGERIGHGLTPQAVGMTDGITAAINSCLTIDHTVASGGATTMWDVDPAWVNFDIMKALLRRFWDGGGMIFQGNATSVAELEDALENPERHPNLIVRVGGFSARFVALGTELQQEIVTRHRHAG